MTPYPAAGADVSPKPVLSKRQRGDAATKAMLKQARRERELANAEALAAAEHKAARRGRRKARQPEKPSIVASADAAVRDAASKRAAEMLGSPIVRYLRKRYITDAQARAANSYLDDWHASRNTKVSQYDQDRVDGSGSAGSVLDIVSRSAAYRRAREVAGPLAPLLDAICIMGLSAEYCALKSGEDRKTIMGMLRAGLDALAQHYGYAPRGYQGAAWLKRLLPDNAKSENDKTKVLATSGPARL